MPQSVSPWAWRGEACFSNAVNGACECPFDDGLQVIGIPTRTPIFAPAFLHDTGLKAGTSYDVKFLRQTFKFVDPPYGVALHNGHQKATVGNFDESEPAKTLRAIHYVD